MCLAATSSFTPPSGPFGTGICWCKLRTKEDDRRRCYIASGGAGLSHGGLCEVSADSLVTQQGRDGPCFRQETCHHPSTLPVFGENGKCHYSCSTASVN